MTGRTHQIRVHASSIGHPVAGDDKYGDKIFNKSLKKLGLNRLFLHASTIHLPEMLSKKPQLIKTDLFRDLDEFLIEYDQVQP